ncbi:MAG: hypothetical protein H6Q89_169, partial [Myxococcaceae bacterium]|nr:hypothetical protein [Myxococcaceae bacterium]
MKHLIPIAAALLFACSPSTVPNDAGGTGGGASDGGTLGEDGGPLSDGGGGTGGGGSTGGGTGSDGGTLPDGGQTDAGPIVTCGPDFSANSGLYVDATAGWNLARDGGMG